MLKRLLVCVGLLMLVGGVRTSPLAAAPGASLQDPKMTTREGLGASGRVEQLDRSSRSLTLRTDEGVVHVVYVEPGLKVFDELQTGDQVTVRFLESVVVALRPGDKPKRVEDSTAAAQKESAENRDVVQQLKATVKIESVDLKQQVVVYTTGDNLRVMRVVADPRLIEGLKPGDVVDITYTRERAIELEKRR